VAIVIVIVVIVMMVMVFTLSVVAVNPMMTVFRPVARDPDHLPITFPVPFTMGVIGTVADFHDDVIG
jgi:hypothetical protein